MGFKKIYKALQEIFPQVDSRALRAVSIEHSNDADAAVEAVLVEIIPLLTERSVQLSSFGGNKSSAESPKEAVATSSTVDASPVNKTGSAEEQTDSASHDVNCRTQQSPHGENDGHNEPFYDTYSEVHEECGENGIAGLASLVQRDDNSVKLSVGMSSLVEAIIAIDENRANYHHDLETTDGPDRDLETGILEDNNQGKSCQDGNRLEVRNYADQTPFMVKDLSLSPSESSAQLVVVSDMQHTNLEGPEVIASSDAVMNVEATSEMVDTEDDDSLNSVVSRSGQICSIDFLEEIISDARNNKKTLFSSMESVISLMKEVELKENDAEQAKMEAAKGGIDVLNRAEELKKMLEHAKEANDMHAGEVYGEKAILATELRELHSRILSLSDERDKSLAILDEMRQTLELRLAVIENEIKSAEQERLEKEKTALKELADQELIMAKVVQESNILKQQAEENAKLREFLVHRGHVVDMLQGEIAVICQDVRQLKQKFDEQVPLSESLSSSQTSCRLASSASSSKSMVPLSMEEEQGSHSPDSSGKPSTDHLHCFDKQLSGDEASRDNCKALLEEDGWEIFDNHDVYM